MGFERERRVRAVRQQHQRSHDPILGAALGELVGTFIPVFGGTAVAVGAILNTPIAGGAYDSLAIALAFGLVLAAVVAAVGHVSGGHVNPAVTLGMAAIGKFPLKSVPFYIGAQLVGAVLGAWAPGSPSAARRGARPAWRPPTRRRVLATFERFCSKYWSPSSSCLWWHR